MTKTTVNKWIKEGNDTKKNTKYVLKTSDGQAIVTKSFPACGGMAGPSEYSFDLAVNYVQIKKCDVEQYAKELFGLLKWNNHSWASRSRQINPAFTGSGNVKLTTIKAVAERLLTNSKKRK